jgi:hypothetical protein
VLDFTHNNYLVPFCLAASTYSLALILIHLLLPQLETMPLERILQQVPAMATPGPKPAAKT